MLEKIRILLAAAENRESFFERISLFLPSMDPRYRDIQRAYNDAKEAFRDKKRDSGEGYFKQHIRAVTIIITDYLKVRDPIVIISAMLHDIVEDNRSWPIERVRLEFGDQVALLVDYMTKLSKEKYPSEEKRLKIYHDRFEFAPREFFIIKLADRLHNLLTIWDSSPEKIAKKIEETKRHYLPYAEKQIILIHELEAIIKELEAKFQQ